MTRTIGYDSEGHPIREDLGPSRARLAGYHGVLVVGGVSPADAQRASQRMYAQRTRAEAKAALPNGRPRKPSVEVVPCGRGHAYTTDEERIAARREGWRRSARIKAQRKATA